MNIGQAIEAVKSGSKVGRRAWITETFIFLVPGSVFNVNRPPLLGIYPEGTEITYKQHIDIRTAGNHVAVWHASQYDLLATDWYVVE